MNFEVLNGVPGLQMNGPKKPSDLPKSSRLPPLNHGKVSFADMLGIVLTTFFKGLVVGLTAAAVTLATAWALLTQAPVYEARSVLLIQLGRDYVYLPDTQVSGLRSPDPGKMDTFVNAEIHMLTSSRVREAALDQLLASGLLKVGPEASRGQLLDQLDAAISINLISGSYLVDIRARGADPELTGEIAKALVDGYLQTRGSMVAADPPGFLQAQVSLAMQRIKQIDEAVARLTGSPSLAAYDQRVAFLAEQNITVQQDLNAATAEMAGLMAMLATLKDRYAVSSVGLATAQSDRVAVLLVETEADLAMATASLDVLKDTSAALAADLAKVEPVVSELAALGAERDSRLAAVTQLQSQLSASEFSDARTKAGFGMVRVIEKGLLEDEPVGLPDRIKHIAAVLVGLLAGLLVIPLLKWKTGRTDSVGTATARSGGPLPGGRRRA